MTATDVLLTGDGAFVILGQPSQGTCGAGGVGVTTIPATWERCFRREGNVNVIVQIQGGGVTNTVNVSALDNAAVTADRQRGGDHCAAATAIAKRHCNRLRDRKRAGTEPEHRSGGQHCVDGKQHHANSGAERCLRQQHSGGIATEQHCSHHQQRWELCLHLHSYGRNCCCLPRELQHHTGWHDPGDNAEPRRVNQEWRQASANHDHDGEHDSASYHGPWRSVQLHRDYDVRSWRH